MQLGGLWLTAADLRFEKGGLELSVDQPLREPMRQLTLRSAMGGCQAEGLGNASPRFLDVNCGMGGAQVDLRGEWRQACDARFIVTMGGMAVMVPDDIEANAVDETDLRLQDSLAEAPPPALNYWVSQKMGEVEVVRR